jgi:short-subunit dehydrogenase
VYDTGYPKDVVDAGKAANFILALQGQQQTRAAGWRMRDPRSILITGASSGIGAALARSYAAPQRHLALTGRNIERLAEVAAACRALGATVTEGIVDACDKEASARFVAAAESVSPLDLVIANAGISGGTYHGETPEQTREILSVNMDGVLNTILPAIPLLQSRRRGQIAIMSSLASFRGFPGAPAYCASKAAVRIWGEALRGDLRPYGIGVCVICPGFVVSRMTAKNRFRMPLLMPAERAAELIRAGLAQNRARIAFPFRMYFGAWLMGALPPGLTDPLLKRLPKKE